MRLWSKTVLIIYFTKVNPFSCQSKMICMFSLTCSPMKKAINFFYKPLGVWICNFILIYQISGHSDISFVKRGLLVSAENVQYASKQNWTHS